jgi:hypothetical protein
MWDDVILTCGNQRVFCDDACLDAWLSRTGRERGYATDLGTVWRLARDWYTGRLDRGYVRREPAAARTYLSSVGLSGSFWGL